jgi:hypothetical protein
MQNPHRFEAVAWLASLEWIWGDIEELRPCGGNRARESTD